MLGTILQYLAGWLVASVITAALICSFMPRRRNYWSGNAPRHHSRNTNPDRDCFDEGRFHNHFTTVERSQDHA